MLLHKPLIKSLAADITTDGFVDFSDWALFAGAWQNTANYNPHCDISPVGGDGSVDINDLAVFTSQWLQLGAYTDIAPQPEPDGKVNFLDFAVLANNWLKGTD